MLVSVVIPTYNRAGLMERAVKSVLQQTFKDLEVIIVDDASTDDTGDRIKSLQKIEYCIHNFRHDKNRGAQAARNTGIRNAKGEYIAFLDSDNEWLPSKLEKQMTLFSQNSGSIGVVYCGYSKVALGGDVLNLYVPQHRGMVYRHTLRNWLTDTSTLVVRKEILERISGFDESIHAYQEWDLCIRLARECLFDFIPECLTLYHQHSLPSISKDHLRDAYGFLDVVEKHQNEILRECGRRALSEHYLKTGRLFILANQINQARAYFLKSVRFHPQKYKALLHFGASLLGLDAYQFLRSWKQR